MDYRELLDELGLYSQLNSDRKSDFEDLVGTIGKKLDKKGVFNPIAYTPHDFSNHCRDILVAIDELLDKNDKGVYKAIESKCITKESLYILAASVVLHDISMLCNPIRREKHSEESALTVFEHFDAAFKLYDDYTNDQKQYKERFANNINVLLGETVDDKYRLSIAEIISAHSDTKYKDGDKFRTLEALVETKSSQCPTDNNNKKINLRLLAALLRFADELDVTNARITGYDAKEYMNEDSLSHWRKLQLIDHIEYNEPNIDLVVINQLVLNDGDTRNDLELLIEVRDKIQEQLSYLNQQVFLLSELNWKYTKVNLLLSDELKAELEDIEKQNEKRNNLPSMNLPPVLDKGELDKKITQWIQENNLLESGHFDFGRKYHARDWIDTHGLLRDKMHLEKIARYFYESIKNDEKAFLIGLGMSGLMIASYINMISSLPFTYAISRNRECFYDKIEKELIIEENKNYYVICDAIVTGDTVIAAVDNINSKYKNSKVKLTFCVLDREPIGNGGIKRNTKIVINPDGDINEDKDCYYVKSINNSFPIEICNKDSNDCILVKHNKQKHLNVGGLANEDS